MKAARTARALVTVLRGDVVAAPPTRRSGVLRTVGRLWLGATLAFAGTSHLTVAREEFQAQVPTWFPADPDAVVVVSGVMEIALGAALLAAPGRRRAAVGWVVAGFFVAIFPGNISQLVTRTDAFGLESDTARAVRLLGQPLLVLWALWSTGAWRSLRSALAADPVVALER
ncbi:DoxX family protein [Cellulomonas fengjieae]|uniref:DoxX family protein n=1 Tax=Cellulomonas fengjieae TaxID=2819978 RepID=UPI001FBBF685|nr:hypothetical protein [Cellulomonas fengjieae]